MVNLTRSLILRRSTSPSVFERGMIYYQEGRVQSVQFNEKTRSFRGVVLGGGKYLVEAVFNQEGELASCYCTCPAYHEYWGDCKHVVAFLLAIRSARDQETFKEFQSKKAAREIFDLFQQSSGKEKTPVRLELTYEYAPEQQYSLGTHSFVTLRIGLEKLYVIKSIRKFFEQLDTGNEIEYGKGFSFDPYWHTFSEQDEQLIEFLREAYEIHQRYEMMAYGNGGSSILFREKKLCLTPSLTRRLLRMLEGRSFRFSFQNHVIEDMYILKENLPVEFMLTGDKGDLLLETKVPKPIEALTPDCQYVLAGQQIYKLSPEQRQSFYPFFSVLSKGMGDIIRLTNEDKDRFVSEVLPFAQKAGTVTVDSKVQSIIVKEDLNPEIYLDRRANSIYARVKFIYGAEEINPFSTQGKGEGSREKILLRDVEKERAILDILGRCGFKVQVDRVYLEDEQGIFDFLYEGLPQLQKYGAVYYSEDLKSMTIRESPSYAGGVRYNAQLDYLEFSFHIDGISDREVTDIFQAMREKKRYYRLKDGSFLTLEEQGDLARIAALADYLELKDGQLGDKIVQIPKYRALYLDRFLREAGLKNIKRNQAFKEMVQDISEPADLDYTAPSSLERTLRGYQKLGFQWLKTLSAYGLGGILADDMGLGKTLQVICLILSEREERGRKPSLVVAPTSLIYNWEAEVEKFAPELKTLVVSGNKEERLQQMESLEEVDVIITSYPLIRRDIENYKEMSFRYCILDEAQHIKNPHSQGARAVKQIKAENRFALTGTPMENVLSELWSIFDFILPGYLFSHNKFSSRYETPIVKHQDPTAMEELSRQVKPFILRRLKKDVLRELPEKIEHKLIAELTDKQKRIYLGYLQRIKGEIDQEIADKGFERSQIKILAGLTRLRQICCHPSTFIEDFDGESGKMQLLEEIIQESLSGGHRILLFSQFTGMLEIIRQHLEQNSIDYLYLDGATKVEKRGELVKAFNEGQGDIFLISLKAGGTGLNLTGADVVIHFDPWWNPAVEDQATDRAYRIGQTKVVHVMKLITRGTIEEKIFELQQRKKELIDTVIQPGETFISKMNEQEIRALFDEAI